MLVLAAGIHIKVCQLLCSQTILRQHTLNDFLQQLFFTVRTSHQTSRSHFSLSTRITSMTQIYTICPLITCQYNFVSIDNDYIIATISVGSEVRLVLTSQQFRNFRTETAQNLVGSVNNDPFLGRSLLVCRNGLVT